MTGDPAGRRGRIPEADQAVGPGTDERDGGGGAAPAVTGPAGRPFEPGQRPLGMHRSIWVDDDIRNPAFLIPAILAGVLLVLVCLALEQFILLGVMLAGVAGLIAVAELRR